MSKGIPAPKVARTTPAKHHRQGRWHPSRGEDPSQEEPRERGKELLRERCVVSFVLFPAVCDGQRADDPMLSLGRGRWRTRDGDEVSLLLYLFAWRWPCRSGSLSSFFLSLSCSFNPAQDIGNGAPHRFSSVRSTLATASAASRPTTMHWRVPEVPSDGGWHLRSPLSRCNG
jgi:hypothetical protein